MILFAIGFLMFMAGFAMVAVGTFEFRGYTFSAWRSRIAGVIFLLFFPLIFGFGYLRELFPSQTWMEENLALFQWGFGILCLGVGLFVLVRSASGSRPKKQIPIAHVDVPMFTDQGDQAPTPPAPEPAPKPSRRSKQGNPFDFP